MSLKLCSDVSTGVGGVTGTHLTALGRGPDAVGVHTLALTIIVIVCVTDQQGSLEGPQGRQTAEYSFRWGGWGRLLGALELHWPAHQPSTL